MRRDKLNFENRTINKGATGIFVKQHFWLHFFLSNVHSQYGIAFGNGYSNLILLRVVSHSQIKYCVGIISVDQGYSFLFFIIICGQLPFVAIVPQGYRFVPIFLLIL